MWGAHTIQHHTPMSRLEIPAFDGDKPRWWIRQCERFFHYYWVVECQKVNLAVAYLNDMADPWFQGWSKRRTKLNWQEFVEDFCVRFGKRTMTDTIEEFNKLRQEGSTNDYHIKFEELKSFFIISHLTLDELYFVSSLISVLKDELRSTVKMMQPATEKQAAEKARLLELALEAIFNKYMPSTEIQPSFNQQLEGNQRNKNSGVYPNPVAAKSSTMEQRRRLGLCYTCGNKFSPGHQCQR